MAKKHPTLDQLQKNMSPAAKAANKHLFGVVHFDKLSVNSAHHDSKATANMLVIVDVKDGKPIWGAAEPIGLAHIKRTLERLAIVYVTELRFHAVRQFRFDIAIEARKICIEYEGIFSGKSRHTSLDGYTRDSIKYNLATTEGWRVLRYTAKNYKNFENDIKQLL